MLRDLRNIAWQSWAVWKLLMSTLKAGWAIDDYPIRSRFHPVAAPLTAPRLTPIPWTANIINWPAMSGNGNTKAEAFENLRKKFERFQDEKRKLPRPGSKVPIEFAATMRVDQEPELTKDFIQRVLDIEWAWISDESSLCDFHSDETNDVLNEKIRRVYGVDVSDIKSGNLADIFDRIKESRVTGGAAKR